MSDRPLIAVLDYGIGNLRSAQKGLEHVGADARLTADRDLIDRADAVVLPGVGAFGRCMEALRSSGLEPAALDAVQSGRPFLGICVGMQLLFDRSDEAPEARGLGIVPGSIHPLPDSVKRPQMQWNVLDVVRPSALLGGLEDKAWVYFVHSYAATPDDPDAVVATCEYGSSVVAAVEVGNVFATQFHPEKSSTAGLRLLANFVEQARRVAKVDLYPSIDLRAGRVVRLYQGDYARETVYDVDPVAVAVGFADAGARWIHVVDLDAARTGEPVNRGIVTDIAGAVAGRARVQTSGGVRSEAAARALADAGAARVVIGTAALEDPPLVARLAAQQPVAVGLDARNGEVALRGWVDGSGESIVDVLPRFADIGVEALIVTDISRDGTFSGPDLDGLAEVLARSPLMVIASGGVGDLADLTALAGLDVGGRTLAGAIVGRALYEGRIALPDALAAAAGR